MNQQDLITFIQQHGFPIIAACSMGGLVYYVWHWVTKEIKPTLSQFHKTLIRLVDRIRMLDNDLIRLNQKVSTVLQIKGKKIDQQRVREQQDQDSL